MSPVRHDQLHADVIRLPCADASIGERGAPTDLGADANRYAGAKPDGDGYPITHSHCDASADRDSHTRTDGHSCARANGNGNGDTRAVDQPNVCDVHRVRGYARLVELELEHDGEHRRRVASL